ncbi:MULTISPECIES: N-acetylmuramoyl-L-alanine amidase [unclassified Staphylococcus]|uniref:N-acetylmuramoyl-L-alanine amidase n=1 Tax=unclassified Staphylococcus TaxID=91994 RepID=UPI0021CF5ADE|nr:MULTISPECIES: N-acetylmuramoyl-L-alanine amidase [unclassified Staphylococcus]UXR77221.1 N-acetylmuramoyl-L-alanine amidase [Staphylococcus sp. IVB6233]UXR81345.1 N-acetylmuramoyl-L-alanine amidase [Staphylococcus sp. IVB6218]
MRKLDQWLRQKRLNPKRVYLAVISLLFVIILATAMTITSNNHDEQVHLIEDAEVRTGPNAGYPVIYDVEEGDKFKVISRSGKWLEVTSTKNHQKGWIAGWHTNLDIKEDVNPDLKPLKGKVIVLDPGHGGKDNGASSKTSSVTHEKEITLKTGLELKKMLEKEGAQVIMTRKDDIYVSLEDRKAKGDAFISIHNDALASENANGATVYYCYKKQAPLAKTLNASIQKKVLLSDRGARQENYQVLRQTKKPAVLLELGYVSNPTDEILMNDQNHRYIVETAIVDGLKNYFLY